MEDRTTNAANEINNIPEILHHLHMTSENLHMTVEPERASHSWCMLCNEHSIIQYTEFRPSVNLSTTRSTTVKGIS